MFKTYDVIIIGAGIMGCCTAFELAKRGVKVAVLEKHLVGSGGTGKSSAIIRQHYSNELTARMALYSLRFFQNFKALVGDECGFTETGFVALTAAKDRAGLEANVALQQRVGIKTEVLSPEALSEVIPGLDTTGLVAAAWEPEGGYADPYLTVTAIAKASQHQGAQIFQNTKVTGIRFAGDKVQGVDTANGGFDAPVVINAAGPWGAQVAKLAGVDAPIDPCRVQVAIFRRPKGHEAPHPVVADFIQAVYYRSETGALTLAGIIDPSEAEAIVDPDHFDEQLDPDFVLEAGERIVNRYPIMEQSQSMGGYGSLYAITPDWHPIVDEVPMGSGFYICSGFSGHGFKLGPAFGLIMADLVTREPDPVFSSRMFSLDRFAKGEPVRGQYEYSIVG